MARQLHLDIRQAITHRTTVSSKWIFLSQSNAVKSRSHLREAAVTIKPGGFMPKSFHLDEADVILVVGALTSYQAELTEEAKSSDEMERETAKADLEHVNRLLAVFKG